MFSWRTKAMFMAVLAVLASAEVIPNPSKKAGAGPLFQIARNGKWGFMDRTGRVVIAPAFSCERDFFHGLAAACLPDGKVGFIDGKGKLVIPARFDGVGDFLDDLAPVKMGRKWGFIDTSGRMVVEPRFQSAGEFHEGLARIYLWSKVICTPGEFTSDNASLYLFRLLDDAPEEPSTCFPQGAKFGYIDLTGKIVIPPQFFVARDFAEGLAAVRVEETPDSRYGYIDRTGYMTIAPRFHYGGPFSQGLAAVETNARVVGNQVVDIAWGFIDKTGVLRIPDKYDFAGNFSEGLARVAIKLGVSMGYIDRDGKMIIPPKFAQAFDFSEGLATACSDECYYVDRSGSPVLKRFHAWWPFSDGLTVIGIRERQFYIDKKGRVIAPYATDNTTP